MELFHGTMHVNKQYGLAEGCFPVTICIHYFLSLWEVFFSALFEFVVPIGAFFVMHFQEIKGRYLRENMMKSCMPEIINRMDELKSICKTVNPPHCKGMLSFQYLPQLVPKNCCDEVFPNIYVGDRNAARDKELIKKLNITHILNAAQGIKLSQVNTNEYTYLDLGVTFLGVSAQDVDRYRLVDHFPETNAFIHSAVSSGGRILVHCMQGISRSATFVLAYEMMHNGMRAADALTRMRRCREVRPNDGFLRQLVELDISLMSLSENQLVDTKDEFSALKNSAAF